MPEDAGRSASEQPLETRRATSHPLASDLENEPQAYLLAQHEGPLPHPATLEQYGRIIPDGAERIMRMAEKEQDQRHEVNRANLALESREQLHATLLEGFGMLSAFMVAITLFGLSAYIILQGYSLAGTFLGAVDVVALVTVFIHGRSADHRGDGSDPG